MGENGKSSDADMATSHNNSNNNNSNSNHDNNPLLLEVTWYYYQNPTTGTVSNAPLTLRQLCKLLVPVREGLKPILASHTKCLGVKVKVRVRVKEQQQETQEQESQKQESQTTEFGEWQVLSDIDVLKEASAQWYLNSAPQKPCSCRTLLQHIADITALVFAPGITPEWTSIEKLPHLQLALEALQPPKQQQHQQQQQQQQRADTATTEKQLLKDSKKMGKEKDSQTDDIQDELEAFLSSNATNGDTKEDDHGYESDGGTRYVKDPLSGSWIHEALAPPTEETTIQNKSQSLLKFKTATTTPNYSKKSKKAKFSKKNAKHWIYVTGLPTEGITVDDVHKYFGKAGLLDLDPETLQPKIKLYTNPDGNGKSTLKGDASICYARPESVNLALQVLDESPWDETHTIKIERAKFQAKQDDSSDASGKNNSISKRKKRPIYSQAQRKVARLALLQAQDEGFGGRLTGGRKGLRIVVVKNMMQKIPENRLEEEIQSYCQELGEVEKITCIEKTKVIIIKFVEPTVASQAVDAWHGKLNDRTKQKMQAIYWDGVTDYTHREDDPEEEEQRHEDFGKWIESQTEEELPPELRLQVAEK